MADLALDPRLRGDERRQSAGEPIDPMRDQALGMLLARFIRTTCLAVPTGMGSTPEAEKSGLCRATCSAAGGPPCGTTAHPVDAASVTNVKPALILLTQSMLQPFTRWMQGLTRSVRVP